MDQSSAGNTQIVKEMKKRDEHDKIQGKESVNLSRKCVLGYSVSSVRPTGLMAFWKTLDPRGVDQDTDNFNLQ